MDHRPCRRRRGGCRQLDELVDLAELCRNGQRQMFGAKALQRILQDQVFESLGFLSYAIVRDTIGLEIDRIEREQIAAPFRVQVSDNRAQPIDLCSSARSTDRRAYQYCRLSKPVAADSTKSPAATRISGRVNHCKKAPDVWTDIGHGSSKLRDRHIFWCRRRSIGAARQGDRKPRGSGRASFCVFLGPMADRQPWGTPPHG